MTIDDVKFSIKNLVLNTVSHRDLGTLCNIFSLSINPIKKINQKNVLDSILASSDLPLLHHILFMLSKGDKEVNPTIVSQMQPIAQNLTPNIVRYVSPQATNMTFSLNLRLYCLSDELMKRSPIDLKSELVYGVNPQNIFVPNFTKYPDGYFNAPSCAPTMVNGRMNVPNAQLPYVSKNTTIKPSPFYCCQVVLHPLSLLIPKPTPNICQPNRIMSKMQLHFTLSSSVRQLITANRCQINNKSIYKWQILIRFGVYDPVKPFPCQSNDIASLSEHIPPYVSISVNGIPVQLWDILPSNNILKEGKRHSRPINISEYIKYGQVDDRGYRQVININWWQTPSLYLYYYAAVFLERKLDVHELLNQFVKKTHSIQRPLSFTLDFIRDKFSSNNKFNKIIDGDDDDLIMSSVLPVSLLCPVGKSRITCPLRAINCQHLQCFDAHLYLMMNERRSVWKCPVCDGQATLNELFVDEYFQQILKDFEYDEEITEVNVNPDGTYAAVAVKESREDRKRVGNTISHVEEVVEHFDSMNHSSNGNSTESQPVILLESDDEKNDLSPCVVATSQICSDIGSAKTMDIASINSTKRNDGTIDLTSDTDDENETDVSNGLPLSNSIATYYDTVAMKSNALSVSAAQQPSNSVIARNHCLQSAAATVRAPFPHLLSKAQSDKNNHTSSHAINPNSITNNSFQRIPLNHQLILHNSNPPNVIWIPSQQNYPYIYQKDTNNKYISTLFSHQLSSSNNQTIPLIFPQKSDSPIITTKSHPIVPVSVSVTPIKMPIKKDANDLEQLSLVSKQIISPTKNHKLKVSRKQVLPKSRGSRHSTRIQSQSRKNYFVTSSSSEGHDTDSDFSSIGRDTRSKKRHNPFNESDSSHSGTSNQKRRRLVRQDSSDDAEEDTTKSVIIEKIMRNPKLPQICITRIDEDVLKQYLKSDETQNQI